METITRKAQPIYHFFFTQVPNYFTSFCKWPNSHALISKNMRVLQMLFGSLMSTITTGNNFLHTHKETKSIIIFQNLLGPETTSIPMNYAKWFPTGLAHIHMKKILPKTRDWHDMKNVLRNDPWIALFPKLCLATIWEGPSWQRRGIVLTAYWYEWWGSYVWEPTQAPWCLLAQRQP